MHHTHSHTRSRRLASVAGALLAGSLALSACSSDANSAAETSSSVPADATFNTADVTFAQGMVPHHEQAVEMARMVDGRSTNAQVMDLAARIEAAQGPEIQTLTGWLEDWNADPGHSGDMGGMGGSGSGMSGMMSEEDMSSLGATTGMDFDRMWLELMLEHHTGAIGMAETEIADGEDADAIAMAEDIQASQGVEITEMEQLLQSLAAK